ncbi:MAG: hypothetical protein ABIJ00_03610 [Candidatus Eisenbacteria bacterium]
MMKEVLVEAQQPLVDITSLNGVESLCRGSNRKDPWGPSLAGHFADFFIYSDHARFTMPVRQSGGALDDVPLPAILNLLNSRDSNVLTPVVYEAEEKRTLRPEYLEDAFHYFGNWAHNSKNVLRRWLDLHREPWIKDGHLARVRPRYVFDVDHLRTLASLGLLAATVGVDVDDILYGFDVVLRYPLYGELAGEHAHFLAHPIRELQSIPTMVVDNGLPPQIALSFKDVVSVMAPHQTLDEYTSFLHEARGLIRDRGIQNLKPGTLDKEAIREIAAQLTLPARLSAAGKSMGVAAGVIAVAGALPVPIVGPAVAIGGGLISVASALWTGTVGRTPARWSWLRWALKWDVEQQASDA